MATAQKHTLQPVKVTLPLTNAVGDPIPNNSPGVVFQFEVLPFDPSVQFQARQLSPYESTVYGIVVTALSPGQLRINMSASVGTAGTNKVADSVDIQFTGNANYQQPHAVVG